MKIKLIDIDHKRRARFSLESPGFFYASNIKIWVHQRAMKSVWDRLKPTQKRMDNANIKKSITHG